MLNRLGKSTWYPPAALHLISPTAHTVSPQTPNVCQLTKSLSVSDNSIACLPSSWLSCPRHVARLLDQVSPASPKDDLLGHGSGQQRVFAHLRSAEAGTGQPICRKPLKPRPYPKHAEARRINFVGSRVGSKGPAMSQCYRIFGKCTTMSSCASWG